MSLITATLAMRCHEKIQKRLTHYSIWYEIEMVAQAYRIPEVDIWRDLVRLYPEIYDWPCHLKYGKAIPLPGLTEAAADHHAEKVMDYMFNNFSSSLKANKAP